MRKGVSAAVNTEGDKQGWSKGQRFGKTVGGVAGLVGQNIKNSSASFFTGVQNEGSKNNVSRMGKGKSSDNTGVDGKQTYGDAKDAAEKIQSEKYADKNNSNAGNSSLSPPDTTPHFDGQRDA